MSIAFHICPNCGSTVQRNPSGACSTCGWIPAPKPVEVQLERLLGIPANEIVVVHIREQDDYHFAAAFMRAVLDRSGFRNEIVVLKPGQSILTLDDEQLEAAGLQRIGSWRDRPPLL